MYLYGGGIRLCDLVFLDLDMDIVVDIFGLLLEVDWRKEGWVGFIGN